MIKYFNFLALFLSFCIQPGNTKSDCIGLPPLYGFPQFVAGKTDKKTIFDTPDYYHLRKVPYGIERTDPQALKLAKSLTETPQQWKLNRKAEGLGMHREITSRLVRDQATSLQSDCFVMFIEKVTASFFIDIYEIARTAKNLSVYYTDYIDIEKPSHESQNHTVLVFTSMQVPAFHTETKLMWHIRYHPPSQNSTAYVNVTVPQPNVHLFCTKMTDLAEDHKTDEDYCNLYRTFEAVMAPCPHERRKLCPWQRLNVYGPALTFQWPVGMLLHKQFVTAVTLFCTVFGAVCVVAVAFLAQQKQQHVKSQ